MHPLALLFDRRRQFLDFLECRVRQPEDAEEILQTAYLKGIEATGAEVSDAPRNVEAWFYRILRNAVIDYYRRRGVSRRARERMASSSETANVPELPAQSCACVLEVLRRLRPSYRTLLELVELQERSVTGVAGQLGISAGNARVRLHRARRALKEELRRFCGTCAENGCADCACRRSRLR